MTTLSVSVPIPTPRRRDYGENTDGLFKGRKDCFVRHGCLANLGDAHDDLLVVKEARVWDSLRKRTQSLCTQNKEASTRGRQGL